MLKYTPYSFQDEELYQLNWLKLGPLTWPHENPNNISRFDSLRKLHCDSAPLRWIPLHLLTNFPAPRRAPICNSPTEAPYKSVIRHPPSTPLPASPTVTRAPTTSSHRSTSTHSPARRPRAHHVPVTHPRTHARTPSNTPDPRWPPIDRAFFLPPQDRHSSPLPHPTHILLALPRDDGAKARVHTGLADSA